MSIEIYQSINLIPYYKCIHVNRSIVINMKTFWDRVDTLRTQMDMTQQKLSEKLKISHRTIESWKQRDYIPNGSVCVAIASLLSTTVEYLVTGEELSLSDDEYVKEESQKPERQEEIPAPPVMAPNGHTYVCANNEEPMLIVPIADQKISAGPGEAFLPPSPYIRYIRIIKKMARGLDPASLIAVTVKGDSMTGVQIFEGDTVIFSRGYVSENGIYVISLFSDLKVKRLEFRASEQKVFIHSENPRYSTEEVPMEDENFKVVGKVVGWIHCHPY